MTLATDRILRDKTAIYLTRIDDMRLVLERFPQAISDPIVMKIIKEMSMLGSTMRALIANYNEYVTKQEKANANK